jgi:hypothetical protein
VHRGAARKTNVSNFLCIAADLLRKEATLEIDVNVFHEVRGVVEAYRLASEVLGTNPQLRRLQQIEHEEEHDVFHATPVTTTRSFLFAGRFPRSSSSQIACSTTKSLTSLSAR